MKINTRPFDFLIVGGGPAGSVSAMRLAHAGARVAVVERSNFEATRVGETLPPAANPILDALGIREDLLRDGHLASPAIVTCWGSDEPYQNDFLFDADGNGWHLDRNRFDALLAHRAISAGATFLLECEVNSCHRINGVWHAGISRKRWHAQITARFLIDAAGRTSWPGRPARRVAIDREVALVSLHANSSQSEVDRRTWIESVRDGWWYSASLPSGAIVAAYFTDADLLHAPKHRRRTRWCELLNETRATRDRLGASEPQKEFVVASASSGIASPLVGDGWVAIGDAACTIDPLSSHGIYYALTSAIDATQCLLSDRPAQALDRYSKRVAARFQTDVQTRNRFCKRERRWPNSLFWRRRTGELAFLNSRTQPHPFPFQEAKSHGHRPQQYQN